MSNKLHYKGYTAEIYYSAEDNLIFGKLEGIKDLVNFHSDNTDDIVQHFYDAVDDYLEVCAEIGKEPEKNTTLYRPKSADQYLELIHDIGYDYDGCCTVESLKALVDELVDYANKARVCLHSGDLFRKEVQQDEKNTNAI